MTYQEQQASGEQLWGLLSPRRRSSIPETNMPTLLLLGCILLVTLLVSALVFWAGARLFAAEKPGYFRAILVALVFLLLSIGAGAAAVYLDPKIGGDWNAGRIGGL